jgi:hypothetical protein
MVTVLVAVFMLAGAIWIAIRMEANLDTPTKPDGGPVRGLRSSEQHCTRMTVGHAYPVWPARCRLRRGATNHGAVNHAAASPAATRPARCTDSTAIHGLPQRHEPVAYSERARA